MFPQDLSEVMHDWEEYPRDDGGFSEQGIRGHVTLACVFAGDVDLDCLVKAYQASPL